MTSRFSWVSACLVVTLASCSIFPASDYPTSKRFGEFPVISTSPDFTKPFAILASPQESVALGEMLSFRLTLINPTNHPIALPDDSLGMINGSLSAQWALDGIKEGYFTGADISSFSTSARPESRAHLEPGEMVDYEVKWRSTCPDIGRINIELKFRFDGERCCTIRLRSLGKANKAARRIAHPLRS